jgi:hypothetical protein
MLPPLSRLRQTKPRRYNIKQKRDHKSHLSKEPPPDLPLCLCALCVLKFIIDLFQNRSELSHCSLLLKNQEAAVKVPKAIIAIGQILANTMSAGRSFKKIPLAITK